GRATGGPSEGGHCEFPLEQSAGDAGDISIETATGDARAGDGGNGYGGNVQVQLGVGGDGGGGGAAGGSGPFAGATIAGQHALGGGAGDGGPGGPGTLNCAECVLTFVAGSGVGAPGGSAISGSTSVNALSGKGGDNAFDAGSNDDIQGNEPDVVIDNEAPDLDN
ncbi:MAG: hypothetical protein WD178_10000, partial [Actinomycetota bacterium]